MFIAAMMLALPAQPAPAHWAFVPPRRPAIPLVSGDVRNPIDSYILGRLQKERLNPSPPAERAALLRRVTLDLTGLPPTLAELDSFLNDPGPNAYEKAVDRLLASPRFGERLAIRWLDAARYADTSGYQNDGERIMWRWRDWVIDAFNSNMPFDRFTIEQLAGDLLPNPTLDQVIATGFNRNHRGNAEGGIIPEEYAVEYVVDRVDTTATVWLGVTMGCVRCHDHKYDPFKQKDYYQLYAFFNSIPEHGRAIKYGNSPPFVVSPTRRQQERVFEITREMHALADYTGRPVRRVLQAFDDWRRAMPMQPIYWQPERGLQATFSEDVYPSLALLQDDRFLDAGDQGAFGFYDKFSITCKILPSAANGAIVSRMPEVPQADGWCLRLVDGRIRLELTKRWLDDALRVETIDRIPGDRPVHIAVVYDGSRVASGVKVYVNGKACATKTLLDELNQTFANKEPLRIGSAGGRDSRFRGRIITLQVFGAALTGDEVAFVADDGPIQKASEAKQRAWFLATQATGEGKRLLKELSRLEQERAELIESFPTTMVMQESPTPRPAFILKRGEYDKPGERVSRGFPAVLANGRGQAVNRLDLAKWLVSPENPLTARVQVNRLWQMIFGVGLVKTAEDFGTQGERPSHPELLDWLATEFIRTGWDVKKLLRLIVTSSTYRQSSSLTPELLAKDPENRLLARGPRLRLSAEMVRDQALALAGLLVERQGGPSVRPYQPAGLEKDLGADAYVPDRGAGLYRRSLYTFWKRTVAPPNMMTFDASGRELCSVREVRTNTPLQALTLLNEVTFVESARKFAERVMHEGGSIDAGRVEWMFRAALSRSPTDAERRVLLAGLKEHQAAYRKEPDAARKLLAVGESPADSRLDQPTLAAFTALAGLILNLDEAITRE